MKKVYLSNGYVRGIIDEETGLEVGSIPVVIDLTHENVFGRIEFLIPTSHGLERCTPEWVQYGNEDKENFPELDGKIPVRGGKNGPKKT